MRSIPLIVSMVLSVGIVSADARAGTSAGGGSGRRHGAVSPAAMLRAEIRAAQAELNRAMAEARRAFVGSSEFVAAVDEMRRATREYGAARGAALDALRQSSDYRSARIAIDNLQRELDAMRFGRGSASDVAHVSRVLLERRGALSRIESNVLKSNDRFTEARYAWLDAGAAIAALWRDFDDAVRHDAACVAARQKIAAARERLASLND